MSGNSPLYPDYWQQCISQWLTSITYKFTAMSRRLTARYSLVTYLYLPRHSLPCPGTSLLYSDYSLLDLGNSLSLISLGASLTAINKIVSVSLRVLGRTSMTTQRAGGQFIGENEKAKAASCGFSYTAYRRLMCSLFSINRQTQAETMQSNRDESLAVLLFIYTYPDQCVTLCIQHMNHSCCKLMEVYQLFADNPCYANGDPFTFEYLHIQE